MGKDEDKREESIRVSFGVRPLGRVGVIGVKP